METRQYITRMPVASGGGWRPSPLSSMPKKRDWTDEDFQESRRRYGAYLAQEIDFNQRHGSHLTDEDVRIRAEERLRQDGLPTAQESQLRADLDSIEMSPVERFATRAERAQRATIDAFRRPAFGESQYMKGLEAAADKATRESSGWLEDVASEGLGITADPVFIATYGAGRLAQAGKFAGMKAWTRELTKDAIADFGAGLATGGIQTGMDVDETLKIAATGTAFAVGGGIVLRGLAKALRVASPNITPEKIRADATKALLRDPEAISEINRLRGTGLSAREAEQAVLSGLDDQLTRALDPEQGTVRGLLDAKRQGMPTYDQYVAKLQEASDAEARGLMAQINESIYDIDYQRAGTRVAEDMNNQRILRSELDARKADAETDQFVYDAQREGRVAQRQADEAAWIEQEAIQNQVLGDMGVAMYGVRKEADKQAGLLNKANDIDAEVPSTQVDKFNARAEKTRQLREGPRVEPEQPGPRPEVQDEAILRETGYETREKALQDDVIQGEVDQLVGTGQYTREQAEDMALYGTIPELDTPAPRVEDVPNVGADAPDLGAPKAEWQMTQAERVELGAKNRTEKYAKEPWRVVDKESGEVVGEIPGNRVDDLKDKYTAEPISGVSDPVADNGWVGNVKQRHKQEVEAALAEGKPVPPEVLKDYPDLTPTRPVEGASGEQLQMFRSGIAPDDIAAMVSDALAAGKWAAKQAIIGARWALEVGGDAIKTMRDFAGVMLEKFGRGIRKHIPEMWQKYKQFRERRAVMRQQTARRRQFGGIDLRSNKVPKNAQQQIASKARAEAKAVAREQRAEREANRAMADMGVKERLPMSERGKFLTRVRKANTANRVNKTLIQADRARAKLEKDLAIEKSRKELLKQIKGRKDSPVRIAAQNSEFADDFNRIHALGVKDPRSGPTLGELRRMDDGQRADVVRAYADIEAKFLKSRADVHVGEEVTDAARGIAKEVNSLGRKEMKVTDGATGERNASLLKQVGREESLQPERLVERLGKRAMAEIYNPIAESKGNYYKTVKSFNEELTARLKQAGIADPENGKWLNSVSGPRANKRTVKLDGQDVTFTDGQFWSLLANLTDPQTRKLVEGGAPISLANDTTRRFKIDEDGLRTIIASSTEQDRAVVKAIKEVYNGTSKDRLNKTWRELFGKDLATHDDYFPRMRDVEKTIDDIEEVMRPAQGGTLEGRSLAKERTENPDAPIIIGDILSTSDKHFAQVSAIVEMAPAVRKVRAILGNRDFKDATVRSYGDSMHRAIDTWVQDVIEEAGGFRRPMTPTQVTLGKLVSNTAVGVLGINPWVIAKQLPSFGNAMTEIEPRYMLQGAKDAIVFGPNSKSLTRKTAQGVRDRMFEHSPQIWARYKVHASRLIGDMRNTTPIQRSSKDLSDWLMGGISWADQNVIASIWRASELKVKAEQPNLGGDAYWKAVNDQADRVIRRTQPNFDSVNTSSIQRKGKGDPFMKAASMFMSQRNTNYNMLYSALASKDPKKIAAILGVVAIAQPLMISGVDETRDWMYGRQEHESGGDLALSLATDVVANNFSQVYFAGPILDPATRGVSNAISGKNNYIFPPSNPITSTANGIQEGIAKLLDGTIDGDGERAWDGFERAMLSAAALGGVPIRSPYRFAEELIERYNEADQED